MMKSVLILSGGVDSTTLLYDLVSQGHEVYALSVDYGQKHSKELEMAKKSCKRLKVNHKIANLSHIGKELLKSALTSKNIDVPSGHYTDLSMKQTVVPNRNMILLSLAAGYAFSIGAEKVFYGAHAGDHAIYPDCRKDFVNAMKKAVMLADWKKLVLEAPYLSMDKGDIVKRGISLKVDYSLAWTCYRGEKRACGVCGACAERLEAFKKAGIKDLIEYENLRDI